MERPYEETGARPKGSGILQSASPTKDSKIISPEKDKSLPGTSEILKSASPTKDSKTASPKRDKSLPGSSGILQSASPSKDSNITSFENDEPCLIIMTKENEVSSPKHFFKRFLTAFSTKTSSKATPSKSQRPILSSECSDRPEGIDVSGIESEKPDSDESESSGDSQPTSPTKDSKVSTPKKIFKAIFSPKKKSSEATSPRKESRSLSPPMCESCLDYYKPRKGKVAFDVGYGVYWNVTLSVPTYCIKNRSIDISDIIQRFLYTRVCYFLVPQGKVIVLAVESDIPVMHAIAILRQPDDKMARYDSPVRACTAFRAAPICDRLTKTYTGMLTVSDFIHATMLPYCGEMPAGIESLKNETIATLKKITDNRPLIMVSPNDNLVTFTKKLLDTKVHRIPVYDEKEKMMLTLISRRRLLTHLSDNFIDPFTKAFKEIRDFFNQPIGNYKSCMGTWNDIEIIREETKVLDALKILFTRKISSLPVLNKDGRLVNIFDKSRMFTVMGETRKDPVMMTVGKLNKRNKVKRRLRNFTLQTTLATLIESFKYSGAYNIAVITGEEGQIIGIITISDVLKFLVLKERRPDIETGSEAVATYC